MRDVRRPAHPPATGTVPHIEVMRQTDLQDANAETVAERERRLRQSHNCEAKRPADEGCRSWACEVPLTICVHPSPDDELRSQHFDPVLAFFADHANLPNGSNP